MATTSEYEKRVTAIHLFRSGVPAKDVAQQLGRSLAWAYKWRKRFFENGDWNDLRDQSRAPKRKSKKISDETRQAVVKARSKLEEEASQPGKLSYIGGFAVYNQLKRDGVRPLPSRTSIERILSEEGMTHPRQKAEAKVDYPHLHPTQPHQLVQIDIVPRYLPGKEGCVSCFNCIDVVSRYPTGMQSLTKRSQDAFEFVLKIVEEQGIPECAQIDNESCFSGGATHPGVIGKMVRVWLYLGVQPVFSPFYLPESNYAVERFHQDYVANTWNKEEMCTVETVQTKSAGFFDLYRQSGHHSALKGQSPQEVHWSQPCLKLPKDFQFPTGKLPLTEGKVHFIRIVQADHTISIANLTWEIPNAVINRGVWATLELTCKGATLRIYDVAPDARKRTCLAEFPFPLKEKVHPLRPEFQKPLPVSGRSLAANLFRSIFSHRLSNWISTMF